MHTTLTHIRLLLIYMYLYLYLQLYLYLYLYLTACFHFAGNFVLLWRRGTNVLTASNIMVTRDDRVRLIDGYNLEISDLEPQDAGDYVCQISDKINRDQVHTVEILGEYIHMLTYLHSIMSSSLLRNSDEIIINLTALQLAKIRISHTLKKKYEKFA